MGLGQEMGHRDCRGRGHQETVQRTVLLLDSRVDGRWWALGGVVGQLDAESPQTQQGGVGEMPVSTIAPSLALGRQELWGSGK